MKRRFIAILCATVLLLSVLALTACDGGQRFDAFIGEDDILEVGQTLSIELVDGEGLPVSGFTAEADNGDEFVRISGTSITGVATCVRERVTVTFEVETEEGTVTKSKRIYVTVVEAVEKVPQSIAITTNPTKVEYTAGDLFDPAGMVVTVTYTDNSTEVTTDYEFSAAPLTADTTQVVITLDGHPEITANVAVTVEEASTPVGATFSLSANDVELATLTSNLVVGEFTICATSDAPVTVDANNKTFGEISYTKRIKFGGSGVAGAEGYRYISFTLTGPSKVTIHALSSSSGSDRILNIDNGTSVVRTVPAYGTNTAPAIVTLPAGTYYIYSPSSGVNVYGIYVEPSTEPIKTPESIAITTNPTKVEYEVGDSFDPAGMVVTITYTDDSTEVTTDYEFSTLALTAEDTQVVITLNGYPTITANVPITVEAAPEPVSTTFSISANDVELATLTANTVIGQFTIGATSDNEVVVDGNSKTFDDVSYTQRIKLGGTGVAGAEGYRYISFTITVSSKVTIHALSSSSGSDRSLNISNGVDVVETVSAYGSNTTPAVVTLPAGTYYVYSPSSGVNVYGIYVEPAPVSTKTPQSIAITTNPTKVEYSANETFDPTGMVVTITYTDASTEVTTDYEFSTVALTAEDTQVVISLEGYPEITANVAITVSATVSTTFSATFETLPAGEFTSNLTIGNFTLIATSAKTAKIEANNKSIDDYNFTACFKTGGTGVPGDDGNRNIKFTLTVKSDVTIYVMSGGSSVRPMAISNGTTDVEVEELTNVLAAHTFTLEAGTYYIYSQDSGLTFYGIFVEPNTAPAKTPQSIAITTNPTKVEYTVGESFNPEGMVVTITYTDASTEVTTDYEFSTVALTAEDTQVVISLEGYPEITANVAITVEESSTPVVTTFSLSADDLEKVSLSANLVVGQFTIGATSAKGVSIDSNSKTFDEIDYTQRIKLGGTGVAGDTGYRYISFTITVASKVTIHAMSSSSGSDRILNVDNGTAVVGTVTAYGASPISGTILLEAGTYYLYSAGSGINVYGVLVEPNVVSDDAVQTGIVIDTEDAMLSFIEGDSFSAEGLVVSAEFNTGAVTQLESADYTIDSSAFGATAGEYTITVNHGTFSGTYNVTVMAVTGFVVYAEKVPAIYLTSGTLDLSALVVKAVASDESERLLSSADYTVSHSFDTAAGGRYPITITYKEFAPQSFDVYVAPNVIAPTNGVIELVVDSTNSDKIGTVDADKRVHFGTINQALTYLGSANYAADVEKVIYILAGTYKEKINIPSGNAAYENITLIGEVGGETISTILTYDDYSGKVRFDGVTCGTDTSASVTVKAKGFSAKYIVFENTYGADTAQALALLVEADMASFYYCDFLGWQDTLEAKAGRQFYSDCYIEGCTDFIFGNNATAYFNNCRIHSLKRNSSTNNGYICATKGYKDGASNAVMYGYIFHGCTFTADEAVEVGTVSIARPWKDYSKIAVIGCEIGGHVSKLGYGETGGQTRYTPMNAADALPTSENVMYIESGNTGDGALAVSVEGCSVLIDEAVEDYINFAIIFGTTNGGVTYSAAWDAQADMTNLITR